MNKSSFVALSLGILVVISCLCPINHGKPAPVPDSECCRKNWMCCPLGLIKRRERAARVKSTLLDELRDARAGVEHAGLP